VIRREHKEKMVLLASSFYGATILKRDVTDVAGNT
jgi:hypothetical protein